MKATNICFPGEIPVDSFPIRNLVLGWTHLLQQGLQNFHPAGGQLAVASSSR
jgi:hypothetical protein